MVLALYICLIQYNENILMRSINGADSINYLLLNKQLVQDQK